MLAYVLLDSAQWMGNAEVSTALAAIPQVQEAHIVAGSASVLVKARAGTTQELQQVLRQLHEVAGVTGTQSIVVLETFFERPVHVPAGPAC